MVTVPCISKFSYFQTLVLLWLLDSHSLTRSREADAVLNYLREQCGAKKLGVIGFWVGGVDVGHLMITHLELKAGASLHGRQIQECPTSRYTCISVLCRLNTCCSISFTDEAITWWREVFLAELEGYCAKNTVVRILVPSFGTGHGSHVLILDLDRQTCCPWVTFPI